MTSWRMGRGSYWIVGWLLTVGTVFLATQYARTLGATAPVVPGVPAIAIGGVLCGIGLILTRRFGRPWVGLLIAGLGIVSVGLGLANLVR